MTRAIYTFMLLILGQFCLAQNKTLYIPIYQNEDTSLLYKLQQEKYKKAGLEDLTKSSDSLHFRFSTETQAVDIWTKDYLSFSGTITNCITGYPQNSGWGRRKASTKNFYSETKALDSSTARVVYELFQSKSIFNIPPQDSIKGWPIGFDGITYIIEHATTQHYSLKSYWTPSLSKDELEEAKKIYELTETLNELLNLKQSSQQFRSLLPAGSYREGMYIILIGKKKNKENLLKPK